MTRSRMQMDWPLLIATLMILTIGLVMVYSASAVLALNQHGDSFFFVKRQLIFAGLGVVIMLLLQRLDYMILRKWATPILILCFLLLIAVLIPGIGVVRGGARSWLGIGSFGIQPSEFMKMGLIVFLATFLSQRTQYMESFVKGLLPPLLLIGLAFALIMLQPDLGTGAVLVGATMMMIYAAGARIKHLLGLALLGLLGLIGLIAAAPYRLQRITAFLDPWQDPLGAGYQAIQSLYAIAPGGLFGLGLGMSRQKFSYLPEPQTDFIYAIIAEELGFIGASLVIMLFAVMIWRGMRIAITAPDAFSCLLATGIVGMVAVQVVINIGVVIGMMPVTGITLPFISYGGSSLTLMLTAIGLLLNISRYSR
jgi:cell division protein FtsW